MSWRVAVFAFLVLALAVPASAGADVGLHPVTTVAPAGGLIRGRGDGSGMAVYLVPASAGPKRHACHGNGICEPTVTQPPGKPFVFLRRLRRTRNVYAPGVQLAGAAPTVAARAHPIAGHALRLALPTGWGGRIFAHASPCPCPVLQAANFPLPASDVAAGSRTLRGMRGGDVRILLAEVGNPPGRRFPPTRLPLRITHGDFSGRPAGFPASHAVAERTFWTAGRSFVLLVDFATTPAPAQLLRQVNRVLATLEIQPTRPLVGAAGWRRLRRPLRLPSLSASGACPRTSRGQTTPETAFGLGSGPAYAVVGARGPISLAGDVVHDGATFHKTLWAIAPSYRGPLLIRGARLDHHGAVRFHLGGPIRGELHLLPAPFGPAGWRYQPSDTVLPAPGCYALQIDATSFTEVVVLETSQ